MRIAFSSPRIAVLAMLVAAFGAISVPGSARAANPLELNFWLSGPRYDGQMGQCWQALHAISGQFAQKESTYWNSDLRITGFADVREVAFRPWESPNGAYNAIPRRFCTASAMISDGHPRLVRYSIIEDGGFAGTGLSSGVEWCVVGLDRNWAYGRNCRAAMP
ncbi:hypothetical protein [[Pseudomonas] carboxydohydrogena]|nr:hypothetical protein [[Pseudomonas] carboxydohydrogena]